MHISKLSIPIPLPDGLYRALKSLQGKVTGRPPAVETAKLKKINLDGDRDIEWSWIAARMPEGPGEALDFGAGASSLGLLARQRGYSVTAVDLTPVQWAYRVEKLSFVQGDIYRLRFPRGKFSLILNCSTVEHAGLPGRYGISEERPDGDLEAMRILADWMKPKGIMLLTIPVGLDELFAPLCRVYGKDRLPRLLAGFRVLEETYWIKGEDNRWVRGTRAKALGIRAYAGSWKPENNYYPIGCFVLQKPGR